jgi:hypothetical protein
VEAAYSIYQPRHDALTFSIEFSSCKESCSVWPEERLVPILPLALLLFAPAVFRKAHAAARLAAVLAEAAIQTGVLLQDLLFHSYFSIPLLDSVNSEITGRLLKVITQLTSKNSICDAERRKGARCDQRNI